MTNIKKGDVVAGNWRCTYASPFRYDFREDRNAKGVSAAACVYQALTSRKWLVYYSPGSKNLTLFRAVLQQLGALHPCSTRADSSQSTSSI